MNQLVDRRVLAGFRCIDAITSRSVVDPLTVAAPPLTLLRNRSGVFAVMDAPGLRSFTAQFLPPTNWPAPSAFEVTIKDPSLKYLARRANISAPQPLASTAPQPVVLYPTPAAAVSPNWAVIRASVVSNATPARPLPYALIQVQGAGSQPPTGLTNSNGEALLAVPGLGLKLSSSASGAVTEATTAATITAWFDPTTLTRPANWIPNPDDILTNLSSSQWKSASQSIQLGPGQTVFVTLTISL
jgi:hypothetical protein